MRPFFMSCLQIFGPDVGQKLFFDETMKQVVKDVLNGQNWLVYTYGITNSGKTHTIQGKESTSVSSLLRNLSALRVNPQPAAAVLASGSNKDGGILPRSLAVIFNSVGDRLYQAVDLKPSFSNEVVWLDSRQVRQEETKKQTMLRGGLWEVSVQLLGLIIIRKGWGSIHTHVLRFLPGGAVNTTEEKSQCRISAPGHHQWQF